MRSILSALLLVSLTDCSAQAPSAPATPASTPAAATQTPAAVTTPPPVGSEEEAIAKGNELARLGQVPTALAFYDQALAKYPNSYVLLANRANLFLSIGKPQNSLDDLGRAFAIADKLPGKKSAAATIRLNRGAVYLRLNQPQKALPDLDAAVAGLDDKADKRVRFGAHYSRAEALSGVNKLEDALKDLNTAMAIMPEESNQVYLARAGVYKGLKQNAKAAADLEKVLPAVPDPAKKAQLEKAIKELRAAKK